jgi:integral membrane sensor domain MASE1
LTASFCVAATGTAAFIWAGTLRWADYPKAVLNWWVGDAVALICLTPFLLIHFTPWLRRRAFPLDSAFSLPGSVPAIRVVAGSPVARRIESCAQGASILLSLWLVFGLNLVKSYDFFYLFFLPILWLPFGGDCEEQPRPSCSSILVPCSCFASIRWTRTA